MSDVLFRYLLTARDRDESVLRRLVLADESWLAAGVEQLVETSVARVEVESQHERVSRRSETVPVSRHRSVRFYDVAQPNPPREGHFERRSQEFPLRGTLRIYTCTECNGRGKVRCWTCSGSGRSACSTCGGSGRVQRDGKMRSCSSCGGAGRQQCFTCHGAGRVTCRTCDGEKQLASWEIETYRWLIEHRALEEFPLTTEESRVQRAFKQWLKINAEKVANLEPGTVAEHLGFETREALEVAGRADAGRRNLEEEARRSDDRYLFHRTQSAVAPVGYTVVRLDGKARYYWLVGRGEKALEVKPSGRPDGLKCAGWLGLGSGSAMTWEGVAQGFDLPLSVLEGLQLGADMPVSWLAGGSLLSWTLALGGARRIYQRKPPVRTLALMATSGKPTIFLTCLAYLGSYLDRLQVQDRAYDVQSERLLGRMRAGRQSESLSLLLPDGRKVRLVEVANPHRLSSEQIQLMNRALDGVMILEEPQGTAAELMARLSSSGAPPRSIALAVDSAGVDLSEPRDRLPLEGVRRAFVEDFHREVDWVSLFDRMWRPLGELLDDPGDASP